MTLTRTGRPTLEGTEWHLRAACRPSRARMSQVDDRVFLPALGEYDRPPGAGLCPGARLVCPLRNPCRMCSARRPVPAPLRHLAGQDLTVKKKGKRT